MTTPYCEWTASYSIPHRRIDFVHSHSLEIGAVIIDICTLIQHSKWNAAQLGSLNSQKTFNFVNAGGSVKKWKPFVDSVIRVELRRTVVLACNSRVVCWIKTNARVMKKLQRAGIKCGVDLLWKKVHLLRKDSVVSSVLFPAFVASAKDVFIVAT